MEKESHDRNFDLTDILSNSNKIYSIGNIPIPRYTYPIVIGFAYNFPREIREHGVAQLNYRVGRFAPVGVALNEAADLGISAELKLETGVSQERVLPLIFLKNSLNRILSERIDSFTNEFPNHRRTLEILKNDFFLLSRNRDKFETRIFLEIDSGIVEAAYTSIALPQILSGAGIDFPGRPCENPDDLISKYAVYCISSDKGNLSENITAGKIQKLHAAVMAMKVDDDAGDADSGSFDRIVGLPNFALSAERESELTGKSQLNLLREIKKEYIEIASDSLFNKAVVKGAVLFRHVSGIFKNRRVSDEVSPTDDLWQLELLINKLLTLKSTILRHNLTRSAIIDRAFSK